MKTYRITLGNTEFTKGHRYRCAHVAVTFEVKAKDEDAARAKLAAMSSDALIRYAAAITINTELAHTGPCELVRG
jgi:hypothetical protein